MASILPAEPIVVFIYDFWLHLVYRTYDPLWVLTLYLVHLINLLLNVVYLKSYLYILHITCEWWVFFLCPHCILPSLLIKISTRLNWQRWNACCYEENIHVSSFSVMPTVGSCLSLLTCKAGNMQVCDFQDDLSAHLRLFRYLRALTTRGSVLCPTNSCIRSSENTFKYPSPPMTSVSSLFMN